MGDEVALPAGGGVRLSAETPVRSRMVLIRDGQAAGEVRDATRAEWVADRPGVYRVEVYLHQFGEQMGKKPWILSNPIYAR